MVYFVNNILTNIEVHFVGVFLYIMDLINARSMGHIKISIMQRAVHNNVIFTNFSLLLGSVSGSNENKGPYGISRKGATD